VPAVRPAACGTPDFSQLYFTVNKSKFAYGDFLNSVISFVIIAAVVYFLVVLPVGKLLEMVTRNEEAIERECPECLSDAPKGAPALPVLPGPTHNWAPGSSVDHAPPHLSLGAPPWRGVFFGGFPRVPRLAWATS
jgi:hypothetical protein